MTSCIRVGEISSVWVGGTLALPIKSVKARPRTHKPYGKGSKYFSVSKGRVLADVL